MNDEARDEMRQQILDIYGLKAWQIGLAPVPWTARLRNRLTFGRTRVRITRWFERRVERQRAKAEAAHDAWLASRSGHSG